MSSRERDADGAQTSLSRVRQQNVRSTAGDGCLCQSTLVWHERQRARIQTASTAAARLFLLPRAAAYPEAKSCPVFPQRAHRLWKMLSGTFAFRNLNLAFWHALY